MSLINDALKRANENEPPPPPIPAPAMQPVLTRQSKLPLVVLPLLLLAVLSLAVWFLVKGIEVARTVYLSSPPTTVAARERTPEPALAGAPTEPVESEADAAPAAAVVPAQPEASAPASPEPAPSPAAVPALPEPVVAATPLPPGVLSDSGQAASFPELKVQAVFYRQTDPAVVINSKMVGVGSTVNGARIISISPETVLVEWRGERRELTLP